MDGLNVDLDLSHFLPIERDSGVVLDEHLLIIEDVRKIGEVCDGLEAAAQALRELAGQDP